MDILSSKILTRNIKKYREKLGLSQDQLARKAGIPYSTYIKIEAGYTLNPSIQAVVNIAQALCVSIDDLLGLKRKS
ncbi:helix-turn-helix domain-containing protein [Thermodesulfovibrionales bacterium]|nr:helix-turn-helix domain-containing protein [Thermodesulfovibrionales bacterium]